MVCDMTEGTQERREMYMHYKVARGFTKQIEKFESLLRDTPKALIEQTCEEVATYPIHGQFCNLSPSDGFKATPRTR